MTCSAEGLDHRLSRRTVSIHVRYDNCGSLTKLLTEETRGAGYNAHADLQASCFLRSG